TNVVGSGHSVVQIDHDDGLSGARGHAQPTWVAAAIQLDQEPRGALVLARDARPAAWTNEDGRAVAAAAELAAIFVEERMADQARDEVLAGCTEALATLMHQRYRALERRTRKVTRNAVAVAARLNLDPEALMNLTLAVRLCDIGLLGVGDSAAHDAAPTD